MATVLSERVWDVRVEVVLSLSLPLPTSLPLFDPSLIVALSCASLFLSSVGNLRKEDIMNRSPSPSCLGSMPLFIHTYYTLIYEL